MSWAAISSQNNVKRTVKLKVNINPYAASKNASKSKKKEHEKNRKWRSRFGPQHKEIEPDPADDYVMTNSYIKALRLERDKNNPRIQHKVTMTPSLRSMIEWVKSIENKSSKIYPLDFERINEDLQHKYNHYKDQNKLKFLSRIYYNFYIDESIPQSVYQYDEEFLDYIPPNTQNQKYFYGYDSVVHYVLFKLHRDRDLMNINKKIEKQYDEYHIKLMKSGAMIIKLLLQNKIISSTQPISWGSFGMNIISKIKQCLSEIDEFFRNNDPVKQQYMDIYFDLFICSTVGIPKQSIITLKIRNETPSFASNIMEDYPRMYTRYTFKSFISDTLIEKLLYHGICPFSMEIVNGSVYYSDAYGVDFNKQLFNKILKAVFKNTDDHNQYRQKTVMTAPLVIIPFVNKIKSEQVFNLIDTHCCLLNKEMANIIVSYLSFCDKFDFYDRNIYKNFEAEITMFEFINYVGQLPMNPGSMFNDVFNDKYNNLEFAKYIMDDKRSPIIFTMFGLEPDTDLEHLYKLVVLSPPSLKEYYYLIFSLCAGRRTSGYGYKRYNKSSKDRLKDYFWVIKFLEHIQLIYPDQFDIHYIWGTHQDLKFEFRFGLQNLLDCLIGCGSKQILEYIASNTTAKASRILDRILHYKFGDAVDVMKKSEKFKHYSGFVLCKTINKWKIQRRRGMHTSQYNEYKRFVRKLNKYLKYMLGNDPKINKTINKTIDGLNQWINSKKIRWSVSRGEYKIHLIK